MQRKLSHQILEFRFIRAKKCLFYNFFNQLYFQQLQSVPVVGTPHLAVAEGANMIEEYVKTLLHGHVWVPAASEVTFAATPPAK